MKQKTEIADDILYIGADDTTLDLFEGQYPVPRGVSYNSYLCLDEKVIVFDTADDRKKEVWLQNLFAALGGRTPDYLIVSHAEPDHSASLPAFARAYPAATIVGNAKTFAMLDAFYGELSSPRLVVKEGDKLRTGKHAFVFLMAPMVHWPEVMMTFDETTGTLFSADAFGKFGALCHAEDWTDEARRYYVNIVGKYGAQVQAVLKKAAELPIRTICPLHGPVLREDLAYYLGKYDIWSAYRPEEKGVCIAYASVYGGTAAAAEILANALQARGVQTELFDLSRSDASYAAASAFRYDKTVLASITYDGGLMPCMDAFLRRLCAKNFRDRTVGIIQNGSWAPMAGKAIVAALESARDLRFCEPTVTVRSAPCDETAAQITALADALANA